MQIDHLRRCDVFYIVTTGAMCVVVLMLLAAQILNANMFYVLFVWILAMASGNLMQQSPGPFGHWFRKVPVFLRPKAVWFQPHPSDTTYDETARTPWCQPLMSATELLAYIEHNKCQIWVSSFEKIKEFTRKVNPDATEEDLDKNVLGALRLDVETFLIDLLAIKRDVDHNGYITSLLCVPINWEDPTPGQKTWEGDFAFLVQDTGMYVIVRDLEVVTLVMDDEKTGKTKHVLGKAEDIPTILAAAGDQAQPS